MTSAADTVAPPLLDIRDLYVKVAGQEVLGLTPRPLRAYRRGAPRRYPPRHRPATAALRIHRHNGAKRNRRGVNR